MIFVLNFKHGKRINAQGFFVFNKDSIVIYIVYGFLRKKNLFILLLFIYHVSSFKQK